MSTWTKRGKVDTYAGGSPNMTQWQRARMAGPIYPEVRASLWQRLAQWAARKGKA